MLRALGYATIVDPDAPMVERDTTSCGHCNAVIYVKPRTATTVYLLSTAPGEWKEVPGAFCRCCMTPVCLRCDAHGLCTPFERELERMESKDRLARAVGIMALLLLLATPASAQVGMLGDLSTRPIPIDMLGTTFAPQEAPSADDKSSRLDLGLGIISISAAMVATGLTSSCLAAKTCHETVPLTRWAFDRGPVWGVLGRAAVQGVLHYAVARWVPKGKWRTATLGTLAAINVTNAALDIRTLREIERERRHVP